MRTWSARAHLLVVFFLGAILTGAGFVVAWRAYESTPDLVDFSRSIGAPPLKFTKASYFFGPLIFPCFVLLYILALLVSRRLRDAAGLMRERNRSLRAYIVVAFCTLSWLGAVSAARKVNEVANRVALQNAD